MRANAITSVKTILGSDPNISSTVAAKPNGLLLHETVLYSLPHARAWPALNRSPTSTSGAATRRRAR
jgi:hypothetical protein